jgi:PAS domain-containing protein
MVMTLSIDKSNHVDWIRNSQRLLDNLYVSYILSDLDNVIREVNDTFIKWYGRSGEEHIGMRLENFFEKNGSSEKTAVGDSLAIGAPGG